MKSTLHHVVRNLIAIVALFLACHAQAQPAFERLYQFETGVGPLPNLALGTDGNYYGATERGGTYDKGTVFRLTPTGVLTTIISFNGANGDTPASGLVTGSDGNFYGATERSDDGVGRVFRITQDGVLTNLANFTNGVYSTGQMVRTNDGTLYGTTSGTVFKIPPGGVPATLAVIPGGNIYNSGLIQGNDGNFYGTTSIGGSNGRGSAFKLTPAGILTQVADFGPEVGAFPFPGLALGVDGNFYGTTSDWGRHTLGTAFKFTPEGVLTVLHHFGSGYRDGPRPGSGLMRGNDDNFYGVYYVPFDGLNLEPAIYKMTPAGTITLVAALRGVHGGFSRLFQASDGSFRGVAGDKIFRMTTAGVTTIEAGFDRPKGSYPGGLVKGSDGNFYGTTRGKGVDYNGGGTVFKISTAGVLTTLASYDGSSEGVVEGLDGNFYGIYKVLAPDRLSYEGTFFKVTRAGALTKLRSVDANMGNTLTRGNDGNFYGTTSTGGTSGEGSFVRMTSTGKLTTLASFKLAGGRYPGSNLVPGGDGNFYGTTTGGGAKGFGTFYEATPAGVLTTLTSLTENFTDPLVKGPDGDFYGTTFDGGVYGDGKIFKITRTGTLTTLVSFSNTHGWGPWGGLTAGSDGNLYGVTGRGGANDLGMIFKVTSGGAISTLHSFDETSGNTPVFGNDGSLYGTGADMIYRLALSPGVFPEPEIVVEQPVGSDLESGEIKNFGNPVIGASTSFTFTIRNGGSAGLTGLAITIDGLDAADFSVSKSPVAPVSPGGVTSFTVKFMPATIGSKSAALHIASNDADEARFDINLIGSAHIPEPEIVVEQPVGSDFASGDIQSFGKIALGTKHQCSVLDSQCGIREFHGHRYHHRRVQRLRFQGNSVTGCFGDARWSHELHRQIHASGHWDENRHVAPREQRCR